MTNANTQILDNITTRAIDLQRLTTRQRREARVFLDKLQADLIGQLAAIDPTGVGQTSARGKRLEKLLAEVKGTIRSAYRKEGTRLANEIANLAEIEATFAATSINKVIGVELITASVTPAALNAIVDGVLIQGAPVSDWLSRQAGDTLQRFGDQMRLGIAEGETNSQLIRRVRGGMQNGSPVTGIMDISRRNADSLVRSATQAVSQKARQATYNENESLIKGEQWVSTIDLRTTLECSTRDGLVYTVGTHEPIDHSLPWLGGPGNLHWGCRSTSAPVLKSFRELGIDLDEVPPSTRASVNGQIAEDTTFEGWLSRRSVEEQNTNLGAGRAQLWRDGKIKFRDLVDGNGRELTLDQLRTKSAAAAVRKRKPRAKPKPKVEAAPVPEARVFAYEKYKGVKNVAQAEAYMIENGISEVAALKGISPAGLSQAIGAAHEVTERFNLKPLAFMGPIARDKRFNFKTPKRANAAVFYDQNAMHLPTKFGNLKDAEIQIELKNKRSKGYTEERDQILSSSTSPNPEVMLRVKKMNEGDYTWSITAADGAAERAKTMYHEYGHVIHKIDEVIGPQIDKFLKDFPPRKNGWQFLVSKYGGHNDAEYIAETFAIYMTKPASEHFRIHPQLLKIYKKADRKNDD